MAVLNREAFMKRVVVEPVELPNGDTVYIRAIPASMVVGSDKAVLAKNLESGNMLVQSLCTEDGTRMFTDGEANDALTIDLAALDVLLAAIFKLNGLTAGKDAQEQAEKN